MLNVAQITSRLAMMPDAALQQYAALHKEDPYIMALAVSESNRRKQMRNAAQVPQGGEMPKVVDQDIAAMAPAPTAQELPEEQGIARLPTGDMNFAGGGIVAFADGGDVERYQVGGVPSAGTEYGIPGMTSGDAYAKAMAKYQRDEPLTDVEKALLFTSAPFAAAVDVAALPFTGLANLVRSPNDPSPRPSLTPVMDARNRSLYGAPSPEPATSAAAANAVTAAYPGRGRREVGAPVQTTAGQRLAPTGTGGKADTAARIPAAGTPAVPGVNLANLQDLYQGIYNKQDYKDPAEAQVAALQKKLVETRERRIKEFDEDVAKQGDVFKGREERIASREAEIGKQRDTNTGLAFLNAGLAIMSTPGGLAQAIGKGARVGTEQFAAGLDKIRAAQDKLAESRDRLEELRINRADLTAKERRALTAAADDAQIKATELGIDGVRQAAQVNRETAKTIFGDTVKVGIAQLEQQGQNARTAATVAGHIAAARIGHPESGDLMAKYTKWLKENPQYMSNPQQGMQEFLRANAALSTLAPGKTSVTNAPTGTLRQP